MNKFINNKIGYLFASVYRARNSMLTYFHKTSVWFNLQEVSILITIKNKPTILSDDGQFVKRKRGRITKKHQFKDTLRNEKLRKYLIHGILSRCDPLLIITVKMNIKKLTLEAGFKNMLRNEIPKPECTSLIYCTNMCRL